MSDQELFVSKHLPRWRCHKIVQAAKICTVTPETLELEPGGSFAVSITGAWHAKHAPQVGGYFVRYDDGYESYSPAEAFEQGYTKLPAEGATDLLPADWLMQYFTYEHLRPELRAVSEPFAQLARLVVETLPRNPERTVALRKLLEAKDCAVRALLGKQP